MESEARGVKTMLNIVKGKGRDKTDSKHLYLDSGKTVAPVARITLLVRL